MKHDKTSKSDLAKKRPKERRYFSEHARKAIVDEIDAGLSVAEASRKYEVSKTSINKWRRAYSKKYSPCLVRVVEHKSDSQRNKQLQSELAQVYELLGQSQAKNMLLEKVIDLADQHYQTDLKKTFANKQSSNYKQNSRKQAQ